MTIAFTPVDGIGEVEPGDDLAALIAALPPCTTATSSS